MAKMDPEKIELFFALHGIEEARVAGRLEAGEAEEARAALVLGFYDVDEAGRRVPNFGELRRAQIEEGEIVEIHNIEYDDDGNGTVCDCDGCKERRGW